MINSKKKGVVFLLWGGKAHAKAKDINAGAHHVLQQVHPSPLAGTSFKTVKDFSKANELLEAQGDKPIDWNVD